jgi:cell division protein FtsW (lipid II flippase)
MVAFLGLNVAVSRLDFQDENYTRISNRQRLVVFVTHLLGFIILYFQNPSENIVRLYGQQIAFLMAFFFVYNKLYVETSKILINNVMYLIVIGFITLTRFSYDIGYKQFKWAIVSVILTLIIPFILKHFTFLLKMQWVYAILGFILLVSVFFYGQEIYGATNWIVIGDYSFQPAEVVKIIYIFFIASIFKEEQTFMNVVYSSLVTFSYITVLILQRDLGMALIFFIIYMVMLYVATSQWLYFFGGLMAASIAAKIAHSFFYHVQVRVAAWQNPWRDITKGGWQIAQSLFAIGTGGWLGLGLGRGMPERIPVYTSDFIFAAIAEEFGSIFAIGLIIIMLYIFMIGFNIAKTSNYMFLSLVAVGISSAYAFQVFLIIGGVTKFIPLTGVTLPFISSGGSSLFASFAMLSILQGVYMMNKKDDKGQLVGDIHEKESH